MKKSKAFYITALTILVSTLWLQGCDSAVEDNTPPKVAITSPLANAKVGGIVTLQATASDDSKVEEVEFFANNQPIGTSINEPWTYQWNTANYSEGDYLLQARAYDSANNEGTSDPIQVRVGRPLELTFTNRLFTDISISVAGEEPRDISAGSSTTYFFEVSPELVTYNAETYGKSSAGARIGLRITWIDRKIDVADERTREINLTLSSDFFFLYLRNDGGVNLTPLYVNYGGSSETQDNILIPPDNTKYSIGYYRAYTDTQVRAYIQSGDGGYVYWNQGTNFSFPFTQNQSVTLVNTYEGNNRLAGYGKTEDYTEPLGVASTALPAEIFEKEVLTRASDEEGVVHEFHVGKAEE